MGSLTVANLLLAGLLLAMRTGLLPYLTLIKFRCRIFHIFTFSHFHIKGNVVNFRILICLALTMIVCLINAEAKIEHLVLYYDYEKDPGNKIEDLSQVKNHGTATKTKWLKNGKFGGGLEFDGKTSVIEVPHHDKLNPGGDQLTIIAWYMPLSFPGGHPPIARKGQVGAGVGCWGFDTPGGKPRGFIYKAKDGQASVAQGQEAMAKDKWNHLAMAYDGKKIQIYLNGKVIGSQDTDRKDQRE